MAMLLSSVTRTDHWGRSQKLACKSLTAAAASFKASARMASRSRHSISIVSVQAPSTISNLYRAMRILVGRQRAPFHCSVHGRSRTLALKAVHRLVAVIHQESRLAVQTPERCAYCPGRPPGQLSRHSSTLQRPRRQLFWRRARTLPFPLTAIRQSKAAFDHLVRPTAPPWRWVAFLDNGNVFCSVPLGRKPETGIGVLMAWPTRSAAVNSGPPPGRQRSSLCLPGARRCEKGCWNRPRD